MANLEERLQAVITKAETDASIWHNIIHGNDTTTVATENGEVPTVSKQLKDVREAITGGVLDVVAEAKSARDETLAIKNDTNTLKETTESLKSETLTLRNQAESFKNQCETTFASISSTTQTSVAQIQTETTTQINNITTAGTTQISNVNSAGATQVALATEQAERAKTYADSMGVKDLSLYQAISELSGTDIVLQDEVVIYTKSVSTSTIFTFNAAGLTKTDRAITFELYLTVTADNLTMTFPSSVSWLNGMTPVITTAQKYLFAFRSFDNGKTWIGNLQGSFA